jgi:hypothetical protein
MPVTELQNQAGGLGTILGLAGGYLAGNPQRKAAQADRQQKQAQQDIENKRNATNDARVEERDRLNAQNIQSEIQARTTTQQNTRADRTHAARQQSIFAQYAPMLESPPKGMDVAQWAQSVKSRAIQDGLSDPTLLTRLNTQAQEAVQQNTQSTLVSQKADAQKFVQGEHALPSDPRQRLSVLMKRLQAERGVPGLDVKPTETLIADTQRQIVDAENRTRQQVLEAQANRRIGQGDQRISISLENRALRGGGANSGMGDRATVIENQALGAKDLKAALRIVESANLPRRDRTEVRQDVMDQFKAAPAARDTSGLSSMGTLQYQKDVRDWMTGGQDPASEPDPTNPKYPKKAAAVQSGGSGPGGGEQGGKTVVGTDGHTYQQLPTGKWKVIK